MLWEKHLPDNVEILVARAATGQPYIPPKIDDKGKLTYDVPASVGKRDKTRIISFKAPHNSAV